MEGPARFFVYGGVRPCGVNSLFGEHRWRLEHTERELVLLHGTARYMCGAMRYMVHTLVAVSCGTRAADGTLESDLVLENVKLYNNDRCV